MKYLLAFSILSLASTSAMAGGKSSKPSHFHSEDPRNQWREDIAEYIPRAHLGYEMTVHRNGRGLLSQYIKCMRDGRGQRECDYGSLDRGLDKFVAHIKDDDQRARARVRVQARVRSAFLFE